VSEEAEKVERDEKGTDLALEPRPTPVFRGNSDRIQLDSSSLELIEQVSASILRAIIATLISGIGFGRKWKIWT
jgi:hypothetical protein